MEPIASVVENVKRSTIVRYDLRMNAAIWKPREAYLTRLLRFRLSSKGRNGKSCRQYASSRHHVFIVSQGRLVSRGRSVRYRARACAFSPMRAAPGKPSVAILKASRERNLTCGN